MIGGLAVQRRHDPRELQIQGVRIDARLGGGDVRFRLLCGGRKALQVRFAERMAGDESLATLELRLRIDMRGPGARQLRSRLFELGGKRARVDHEQQLPLGDVLPIPEVQRLQQPRHPGAHFDGLHRFKPAGVVVPFGDFPMQRYGHHDHRGCARRRRLPGAAAQSDQSGEEASIPGSAVAGGRFFPGDGAGHGHILDKEVGKSTGGPHREANSTTIYTCRVH